MIFSTGIIKDFAENIFSNLTTVLVYQGDAPSASLYIAGFTTTYSWTGPDLLQAYNGLDAKVNQISRGYQVYKFPNSQYSTFSKRSGTAAWAVLLDKRLNDDLLTFDSSTQSVVFKRNITAMDLFMIVPVTNLLTNGVVRFASVEFTHPANEVLDTLEIDFRFNN